MKHKHEQPKPKAEKVKRVCDPRMVAAARELRDRWLEQVNSSGPMLPGGKYDVTRQIAGETVVEVEPLKILPAA